MGRPTYKICRLFVIHGSCTGFQSKNKKTKSVEQKVYWPLMSLLFRMSQSLIKRSELLWKSEKKKQPICYHWRIDSGCEWLTRVTKDNMMHAGWSIVVSLPCVGDNLGQQQERAMKISVVTWPSTFCGFNTQFPLGNHEAKNNNKNEKVVFVHEW